MMDNVWATVERRTRVRETLINLPSGGQVQRVTHSDGVRSIASSACSNTATWGVLATCGHATTALVLNSDTSKLDDVCMRALSQVRLMQ